MLFYFQVWFFFPDIEVKTSKAHKHKRSANSRAVECIPYKINKIKHQESYSTFKGGSFQISPSICHALS